MNKINNEFFLTFLDQRAETRIKKESVSKSSTGSGLLVASQLNSVIE